MRAFKFIILMGFVSLFADVTYEGARSITGPFLGILGAQAALVGFIAGLGELIGYTLRLFSGYLVDKTKKYWFIMFLGYICNLMAVPLLACASSPGVAAGLIVMERVGKGIRIPARDAMLSYAGQEMGMGKSFGIHEAMDKLGATLGPLMIALILSLTASYQQSFAGLTIPAVLALLCLIYAFKQFPHPHDLASQFQAVDVKPFQHQMSFWIYLFGAGLVGAAYADFALIAYHLGKTGVFSPAQIPLIYALVMGSACVTSPILGYLYDRYGMLVLIGVIIFSALAVPCLFLGGAAWVILGALLWGLGLSGVGPVMRVVVAHLVGSSQRGSAYGVFNMVFGLFWFFGSVIMGLLYDYSVVTVVIFSMILQLAALPCFGLVKFKVNI